jgi:hypothetical protein
VGNFHILIYNEILTVLKKQKAGCRTYTGNSKRHNPASRKGTLYNPKEVEEGRF